MQLSESQLRELGRQTKKSRFFWQRRGWLRYSLLALLLGASAVALRGGLWSDSPVNAAKRRNATAVKAKSLPVMKMLLEHNERDINLKIKRGKHTLPRPEIKRKRKQVTVSLKGVHVRPRKWTLSGSRVASIDVHNSETGSLLVITQDPKIKGALKDAFSAEDVQGDLVLRVLNHSIGDRAQKQAKSPAVGTKTQPSPDHKGAEKAKEVHHPLAKKLADKDQHTPVQELHPAEQQGEKSAHEAETNTHHGETARSSDRAAPVAHPTVQVVEHPVEKTRSTHEHGPAEQGHPTGDSGKELIWTTLSLAGSILAFGLMALVPILWWKRKQQDGTGQIKVRERLALSPKHSLVRVQLEGRELWLGLSDGNIQVISPSATEQTARSRAPMASPQALTPLDELKTAEASVERSAAGPPPTMARRKLRAFKMRLREALAHPGSANDTPISADVGQQADAIRRELARRQAVAEPEASLGEHSDAA